MGLDIGSLHRWYDQDIQLSELVRTLETLREESQTLFAFLLTSFSDEIRRVKGARFFQELQWGKLLALYKSKRGRRWYDREAVLHKAFNKLYSLTDADKAQIARNLVLPIRMVKQYESECDAQQQPIDLDTLCSIVEFAFNEDARPSLIDPPSLDEEPEHPSASNLEIPPES